MRRTCDGSSCCLHTRVMPPIEALRKVARALGMKRLRQPDGSPMPHTTYPTEGWTLRVKLSEPDWTGATHHFAHYSVPRPDHCTPEDFWSRYEGFLSACHNALTRGRVKKKRRERAWKALNNLTEYY